MAVKQKMNAEQARAAVLEVVRSNPAPLGAGAYTIDIIRALPDVSIRQVEAALTGLVKRGAIRDDRHPVESHRWVATEGGE